MRARALVIASLAALASAGCAAPARQGADDDPGTATIRSAVDRDAASAPATDAGADPAALSVARAFTLASRTWSARTLTARWRRQIALATGPLRSTLRATEPAAADVARVRADHASATASVLTVAPIRVDAGTVQVLVRLAERVTAAGRTSEQTTANQVDLVRHGHAWRVTAFTLASGAP